MYVTFHPQKLNHPSRWNPMISLPPLLLIFVDKSSVRWDPQHRQSVMRGFDVHSIRLMLHWTFGAPFQRPLECLFQRLSITIQETTKLQLFVSFVLRVRNNQPFLQPKGQKCGRYMDALMLSRSLHVILITNKIARLIERLISVAKTFVMLWCRLRSASL